MKTWETPVSRHPCRSVACLLHSMTTCIFCAPCTIILSVSNCNVQFVSQEGCFFNSCNLLRFPHYRTSFGWARHGRATLAHHQFCQATILNSLVRHSLPPIARVHRDDVDFFTHMEMYMRQEKPTLCGRDHISYRSYYLPAKVQSDKTLVQKCKHTRLSIERLHLTPFCMTLA